MAFLWFLFLAHTHSILFVLVAPLTPEKRTTISQRENDLRREYIMISKTAYDELSDEYRELSRQLEANPLYRDLQALRHILDKYERERTNATSQPSWKDRNLATSPEEREEMIAVSERHMVVTGNAPKTMKKLAIEVQSAGIAIKGKYPGTTLGAILSQREGWILVDKRNGLWKMTDEAFAAARAKYQFTANRQQNETAGFKPAA